MGSECYPLGLKTGDYKGQKFFLIRAEIGAGRGTSRAQGKVRRHGKGEMEALRQAARGSKTRLEGQHGAACPALTHSSHRAHRRQSAQRPTAVKTARDIGPSADRHPLYRGAAGQGTAAGGLRRAPSPSLSKRGDLAESVHGLAWAGRLIKLDGGTGGLGQAPPA